MRSKLDSDIERAIITFKPKRHRECDHRHDGNCTNDEIQLKHSATITELCNNKEVTDEVELLSLIEEQIPKYKLRCDTITEFSGYDNSDWFIRTPIIPSDAAVDLSPETISETLNYFLVSSERLSQMTKTYNDIEAVTRLLEEKERDLELSARIGQSLLEQNKLLKKRNEELENEVTTANDSVEKFKFEILTLTERATQLKHELSMKNGLLHIYSADLDTEEAELEQSSFFPCDRGSLLLSWDELQKKVKLLDEENVRIKAEAEAWAKDIEIEERKELQLIHDCAKQLTEANLKIINYQDDAAKRADDNIRQQNEISHLLSQIVELQKKLRNLTSENDALQNALQLAHECQNDLSSELIDLKEKYGTLLSAFHELQEELKKKTHHSFNNWAPSLYMPIPESLASEIESTLSDGYESESFSNTSKRPKNFPNLIEYRPQSPDSVLSGDSLNYRFVSNHLMNNSGNKSFYLPNKLLMVKPFEGSEILRQWQKLATPHLGVVLEQLPGVPTKAINNNNDNKLIEQSSDVTVVCVADTRCGKNFVTTSSIFTFTTTSLSQTSDSTIVTPSFATVQLSTGIKSSISSQYSDDKSILSMIRQNMNRNIFSSKHNSKADSTLPVDFNGISLNPNKLLSQSTKAKSPSDEMNYNEKCSNHSDDKTIKSKNATDDEQMTSHNNNISKLNDTTNCGFASLIDDNPNSEGIITKYSSTTLKQISKGLSTEKCNFGDSSSKRNYGDMLGNSDIRLIKTLRKGGYV